MDRITKSASVEWMDGSELWSFNNGWSFEIRTKLKQLYFTFYVGETSGQEISLEFPTPLGYHRPSVHG